MYAAIIYLLAFGILHFRNHFVALPLWNIFAKKAPKINNFWINVPIDLKFLGSCFLPLSKILEKFWGRTPPPSRGWGGKFFHIHLFSLFEARVLDILIFKTPSQKFESPNPTSGGGLDWGRRGNFYIIDCFHPKKTCMIKICISC